MPLHPQPRPPLRAIEPGDPGFVDRTGRFAFLDLGPRMCRWEMGAPLARPERFCSARTVEGKSYCPGHLRLAHQVRATARPALMAAE